MTLKASIFEALKDLVENRVYPERFPQPPATPTWPSIRFNFAGGAPAIDLDGDGDESTDDQRVQIDWVAKTDAERATLTPLIRAAMKTIDPPCVMQGTPTETWDAETKTYRATADWIAFGSSTS
jgi:hypothetical protein